jgi:hypothetical protein
MRSRKTHQKTQRSGKQMKLTMQVEVGIKRTIMTFEQSSVEELLRSVPAAFEEMIKGLVKLLAETPNTPILPPQTGPSPMQ